MANAVPLFIWRTHLKTKPAVHIYTLSRLVHAPAGRWERKIDEIEKGRDKAYAYYQPMREAVIAYCAAKGNREGWGTCDLALEYSLFIHLQ